MKLTSSEIEYVKQFIINKKYIYVEEQIEIVDHFISILEDDERLVVEISFESLVELLYEENKVDLLSIQKSVKKSIAKKYNKIFYRNLLEHTSVKYILLYFMFSFLYCVYLMTISVHLDVLTIYIPFFLLMPLSVWPMKRKFTAAKGKFLANRYASRIFLVFTSFGIFPGNVVYHLALRFELNSNLICLLVALLIMFEIVLFRSYIKTIFIGALDSKAMEDRFKIVNS